MQLHGPTEPVDTIPVEPYGTSGNVALRFPASVSLILTSAADADRLIIAATQAKDLLLVTQQGGDEPGKLGIGALHSRTFSELDEQNGVINEPLATPFPHLPHLAEHQGGRPGCIICGIDHDAAARLAPPARYGLPSIELLTDGA